MEYKVLWVDDQEFPWFLNLAIKEGLDITQVSSWEEAEPLLRDQYDDWSALILDCYCKIKRDGPENPRFLTEIFPKFFRTLGNKRTLPWYIFSGCSDREGFNEIIKNLNTERLEWDNNWQKGYYTKLGIDDNTGKRDCQIMLENIKKVAEQTVPNKVRAKYPEAFEAARFFGGKIEHDLLEFLVNDYKNDLTNTHRYYNWVRNIMEGIFNHGKEKKIFPPLNDINGFGLLLDKGSTKDYKIKKYDIFIPKALGHAASILLVFSNEGSHYKTDNLVQAYVKETNNINLFRAMLYIEMDLLVWYHKLCLKVDDPQNADFTIGNLWDKPTPIVQLNQVQVQVKTMYKGDREHFVVEKDGISVELLPGRKTVPNKLKNGVFVNVRDYKYGHNNPKLASCICYFGDYDILYKKITIYDENKNELKSDSMSGLRNATVSGEGENYYRLPHIVIVTPSMGCFIKDIVINGKCSDETKFVINNNYINANIDINELIEDLSFIVTTRPYPKLTISKNLEEGGSISDGGAKAPSCDVSITAEPSEGYEFVEWQGCDVVKDKTSQKTTLSMPTTDVSLVAIFKKKEE